MIDTLIKALEDQKLEPIWRDVADSVWLAAVFVSRAPDLKPPPDQELPAGLKPVFPTTPPEAVDHAKVEHRETTVEPEVPPKPKSQEPTEPAVPIHAQETRPANVHGDKGPGLGRGPGLAVRVPGVRALPESLAIGRALRPLARREPSRFAQVFDEDATVRRAADLDLWAPVLRPAPARTFELALVVDDALSMAAWRETLREFRGVLERLGAFRDVRAWRLRPGPGGEESGALMIAPESDGRQTLRSPDELRDPTGRRVILLASDCVSDPCRDGRTRALIADWGQMQPVAVVQMLPQSLWRQTGLGRSVRAIARAPRLGAPNARLDLEGRDRDGEIPVPVLTLDPDALGAWARMLTHPVTASIPTLLLRDIPRSDAPPAQPEPSPRQRVERFARTASRPAQELAACLAAVPLRLPIMRLVQHVMVPGSRPTHLAEVLLGGLLRIEPTSASSSDPDNLAFEFHDDIREVLIDRLEFPRAVETFNAVSQHIPEHFGEGLDFQALVKQPELLDQLNRSPGDRPFAQVAARLLKRLGGRHAELARQFLEGGEIKPPPEPEPTPAEPPPPSPAVKAVLRRTLSTESWVINSIAWSPDGSWLAIQGGDGELVVMSVTGSEQHRLPQDRSPWGTSGGTWSPDSQWVAYSSRDYDLWVWSLFQQRVLAIAAPFTDRVISALAWSPDGGTLAIGNRSDTGYSVHMNVIYGSALQTSDKAEPRVVPSDLPGLVHIVDPDSRFNLPSDPVALAWSRDGRFLAASCAHGEVRLIDRKAIEVPSLPRQNNSDSRAMAWWPDSIHLATMAHDGSVAVWNVERVGVVQGLEALGKNVRDLSVSADGRLLAAKSFGDEVIRIYRCDTWEQAETIEDRGSVAYTSRVVFSPHDPHVLAIRAENLQHVQIWDLDISDAVGPPSFPSPEPPPSETAWEKLRSAYPAPAPPEPWIDRPDRARIVEKLVSSDGPARVGLFGPGASGKTALAAKVASDPEIRAAFPDGVLWFNLLGIDRFGDSLRNALVQAGYALDPTMGSERIMAWLATTLAGKRWLLVAHNVPDSIVGVTLLGLKAPATLFVARSRGALDALGFSAGEIIQVEPRPTPARVDELDLRRLLLFAPQAGFSLEAAMEVLEKNRAVCEAILGSEMQFKGVRPDYSPQHYQIGPPLTEETHEPLPADDPAFQRFVNHYKRRVEAAAAKAWESPARESSPAAGLSPMVAATDNAWELEMLRQLDLRQLLKAVAYAESRPRDQLDILLPIVWVLAREAQDFTLLFKCADLAVKAADRQRDKVAIGRIAAEVRRAGVEQLWTGPGHDRVVALGFLGKDDGSILKATELEDEFQKALTARDLARAVELGREFLAIRQRVLGNDHPETILAMSALGLTFRRARLWEGAAMALEEALAIRERVYGSVHPETAIGQADLAAVYRRSGELVKARDLIYSALASRQGHFGVDSPESARCLAELAAVEQRRGRLDQAEGFLVEALQIREKTLGHEHVETANSLANLGVLLHKRGQHEKAREHLSAAVSVREKLLGPDHEKTRGARRWLAAAEEALKEGAEEQPSTPQPQPNTTPPQSRPALSSFFVQLITDALLEIPGINGSAVRAKLGVGRRPMPAVVLSTEVSLKNLVNAAAEQGREGLDRLLANADKLDPKPSLLSGFDPRRWGKRAVNQPSPFAKWRKRLDEIIAWPSTWWEKYSKSLEDDQFEQFVAIFTDLFTNHLTTGRARRDFLRPAEIPDELLDWMPWNAPADRLAQLLMLAFAPGGILRYVNSGAWYFHPRYAPVARLDPAQRYRGSHDHQGAASQSDGPGPRSAPREIEVVQPEPARKVPPPRCPLECDRRLM